MYTFIRTKQAKKDFEKLRNSNLKQTAYELMEIIEKNPYEPPVEKMTNQIATYSRRINRKHRLVYEVYEEKKIVKIISAWNHYDDN